MSPLAAELTKEMPVYLTQERSFWVIEHPQTRTAYELREGGVVGVGFTSLSATDSFFSALRRLITK